MAGEDVPQEVTPDLPTSDGRTDQEDIDDAAELVLGDEEELGCLNVCTNAAQCGADDVFCNGEEYCDFNYIGLEPGQGCCDVRPACGVSSDPCREFSCIEAVRQCVENPVDADDDGYAARVVMDPSGTPVACGGDDCDDRAYAVHPGAPETCDDVDNDCDGVADEDAWSAAGSPLRLSAESSYVSDADMAGRGDGWLVVWVEPGSGILAAAVPAGAVAAASRTVAGTDGAAEIELVVRPSGGIFLFWTSERAVHAAELSDDDDFSVLSSVTLHTETETASTATDLAAAMSSDGLSAAVFFRSQQHGNSEIYMSVLDLENPSAPPPAALRVSQAIGFSGYPDAAAGPDRIAVVWEDERDGNKEIYAKTLNPATGEEGRAYRITAAPGDSSMPSIAEAGDGFWAVWMDESGGPFNTMASRLDGEGAPESYPIASTGAEGSILYPRASPDPRGSGHEDQVLILQVVSGADQKALVLTGVGDGASAIQQGTTLHTSSKTILKPTLSQGSSSRALVWIEWEYARSDLFFLEIACL